MVWAGLTMVLQRRAGACNSDNLSSLDHSNCAGHHILRSKEAPVQQVNFRSFRGVSTCRADQKLTNDALIADW